MTDLKRETLIKLCDFFLHLSSLEIEAEIIRQLLCEYDDYHPYVLFKYIDQIQGQGKGQIAAQDILLFLEEQGIVTNHDECKHFVKMYSEDLNEFLLYSEFLRVVLPANNQKIRSEINFKVPESSQKIDKEICYTMAKLIVNEIQNMAKTTLKLIELEDQTDYCPSRCFSQVDRFKTGRLLVNDFREVFNKAGMLVYDKEINAVFRRIDLLNDGIIDEQEFRRAFAKRARTHDFFKETPKVKTPQKKQSYLQQFHERQSSSSKKQKKQNSSLFQSFVYQTERAKNHSLHQSHNQQYVTPIKAVKKIASKSILKTSPDKSERIKRSVSFTDSKAWDRKKRGAFEHLITGKTAGTQKKNLPASHQSVNLYQINTPKKKYNEQKTQLRAELELFKIQTSAGKKGKDSSRKRSQQKPGSFSSAVYFCEVLNQMMEQEKDIESVKIQLASQPEFNLCDAFRILDAKKQGYLTQSSLDGFTGKKKIDGLFKAHAQEGRMRFTSFINMLEPFSQDYQEYLHKKQATNQKEIFNSLTSTIFGQILLQMNNQEVYIEKVKRELQQKKNLNLKDLFLILDEATQDNHLNLRDLDEFFYKYSLEPDIKDLQLLFNRIDVDKDGRISFSDFIETFSL